MAAAWAAAKPRPEEALALAGAGRLPGMEAATRGSTLRAAVTVGRAALGVARGLVSSALLTAAGAPPSLGGSGGNDCLCHKRARILRAAAACGTEMRLWRAEERRIESLPQMWRTRPGIKAMAEPTRMGIANAEMMLLATTKVVGT
jgi:hypothetical protein